MDLEKIAKEAIQEELEKVLYKNSDFSNATSNIYGVLSNLDNAITSLRQDIKPNLLENIEASKKMREIERNIITAEDDIRENVGIINRLALDDYLRRIE